MSLVSHDFIYKRLSQLACLLNVDSDFSVLELNVCCRNNGCSFAYQEDCEEAREEVQEASE